MRTTCSLLIAGIPCSLLFSSATMAAPLITCAIVSMLSSKSPLRPMAEVKLKATATRLSLDGI